MSTEVESVPVVLAKAPAKPKKAAAPKKPAEHPPYIVMISECIKALKERNGTSRQAILRYILKTYKLTDQDKVNTQLKTALKRGVANNSLKQVKGTGASGSFKLADAAASTQPAKKPSATKTPSKPKTAAKNVAKPKPSAKSPGKKTAAKKSPSKQSTAKKPAAKKPKKPVAKKPAVKKPAAKKSAKSPAKKSAAMTKKAAAKK